MIDIIHEQPSDLSKFIQVYYQNRICLKTILYNLFRWILSYILLS